MPETTTNLKSDIERFAILQSEISSRFLRIGGMDNYQQQFSALVCYDAVIQKLSTVTPACSSKRIVNSVGINCAAIRHELVDLAARALVLVHHHRVGSQVDIITLESTQDECRTLFLCKNADYGDSYKTYGPVGVIIRLQDKLKRVVQLTRSEARVKTESIVDTLLDIYNYSLMAVLLIDSGQ
jgi:hypothetical protein